MKINSKNRGFVEGTLVLMADGSQKPIEQVKTGDMVLSFDEFDSTAPLESMRVTNTFIRIDSDILEVKVGENILKVAKDQMFIGPHNDWKEVYNHSTVVDLEGTPVKYTVNQTRKGKHRVYDITVEENHSLIANGIRVHNIVGGGTQSQSAAASSTSRGAVGGGLGEGSARGFNNSQTKTSNPKGTSTTKDSKTQNSNAGRTSTQSAGNSLGSRNNSGGDRRGGGNRDVGINNANNANNKKVSNGANGYKKKPKKSNDELAPTKPKGSSVAIKLMESVDNNVDVLQELIQSYTPAQLTTAKLTIQVGVDSIHSFANDLLAAVFASELNVYDKAELIQIATQIMAVARDLRDPFEETVVSAEGKKIALVYLSLIEATASLGLEKLGAEVVNDGRGGFEVTVNGQPSSQRVTPQYTKKTYEKPVKTSNGKYTTTKRKPNRKVRASTRSSAPAR